MAHTLATWALLPDDWVSPEEAAEFLGVGLDDLRRARKRGVGPTYRRLGQMAVRYLAGSLPDWQGKLPVQKGIPTPETEKVSEVG